MAPHIGVSSWWVDDRLSSPCVSRLVRGARLSVTATPAPRTVLDRRHVRVTLERLLGLRIDLTDWHTWPRTMSGCGLSPTDFEG